MNSKILVSSFFLLFFVSTINESFSNALSDSFITRITGIFDELYVILLFVYTLLFRIKKIYNSLVLFILFFFIVSGLIGNYLLHTSITVALLGLFSTCKPIILYWCFCQYDIGWADVMSFFKKLMFFFPIILVSYLLDLLTPSFRSLLGYPSLDVRLGFRTLGGFFAKQTTANIWLVSYYIIYKYYYPIKSKWRTFITPLLLMVSFKVKDLLGFLFAFIFSSFKKIKFVYFVVIVPLFLLIFYLYMILMPDHYARYFENDDDSNIARVVLTYTSFKISYDYFPFGVGFGQYASPISRDMNSDIYHMYHIDHVWGLTNRAGDKNWMCDTFWPMLLGETGYLGTIFYIILLVFVFKDFIISYFKDTSDVKAVFPAFLFIVYLVETIGKPVFVGPPHSLLLWGVAGLFYSAVTKNNMSLTKHISLNN